MLASRGTETRASLSRLVPQKQVKLVQLSVKELRKAGLIIFLSSINRWKCRMCKQLVSGTAKRHNCKWGWFRRFVVDLSALARLDDPAAPMEERTAVRRSCVRVVAVFHGLHPDTPQQLAQREAVLEKKRGAESPQPTGQQRKAASVLFGFDLVVAPAGDKGHGLFAMRSGSEVAPTTGERRRLLQPAAWMKTGIWVNVRGRERLCLEPVAQDHYMAPYTGLLRSKPREWRLSRRTLPCPCPARCRAGECTPLPLLLTRAPPPAHPPTEAPQPRTTTGWRA